MNEIGEKKEIKPIWLTIMPTRRCDTGCRHCICESTGQGNDLSLDSIVDLRKSINSYPGPIWITFTGGGEPLMWLQLPEAIDILRGVPSRSCASQRKIALVTSGCLNEKDKRFPVLVGALRAHENLTVWQSFNLFAPSFPQRVKFTLPFLLETVAGPHIFFMVAAHHGMVKLPDRIISSPGIRRTFERLEKIIGEAVGPFKKLAVPHFNKGQLLFLGRVINWRRHPTVKDILGNTSFMGESFYAPLKYSKVIVAHYISVQLGGRAKFLRRLGKGYSPILHCDERCYSHLLTLDPSGDFVFCSQRGFPHIKIGRPGGSLREVLKKRNKIFRELDLDRLRFSDLEYFTICEACQRKAWQLYG